jgi:hypothetical protein
MCSVQNSGVQTYQSLLLTADPSTNLEISRAGMNGQGGAQSNITFYGTGNSNAITISPGGYTPLTINTGGILISGTTDMAGGIYASSSFGSAGDVLVSSGTNSDQTWTHPSSLSFTGTTTLAAVNVSGAAAFSGTTTAPTQSAGDSSTKVATTAFVAANAPALASANPGPAQGRLTNATGIPYQTATVAGSSTIYYTPYVGTKISLWNGTAYQDYTFSEMSITTTGLATASVPYDFFIYQSSGTPTPVAVAWTSTTARATLLTFANGIYYEAGTQANRYVGTFYLNASKQVDFILGTFNTSGQAATIGYWNLNNQVQMTAQTGYTSTSSWTYEGSGTTWRQENGSTANQINFVVGLTQNVTAQYTALGTTSSTGDYATSGVGFNSTTSPTGQVGIMGLTAVTPFTGFGQTFIAPGLNYVAAIERGFTAGTQTWYGAYSTTGAQSSLVANWNF